MKTLINKFYNYRYPSLLIDSKDVRGEDESNIFLYNAIKTNRCMLIARFGTSEISGFWQQVVWEQFPLLKYPEEDKKLLRRNAGMFSVGPIGRHIFKRYMKNAIKKIDALCVMYAKEEKTVLDRYGKNDISFIDKSIIHAEKFLYYKKPWTNALENKKVLVISPFAELMYEQYKIKDVIHTGVFRLPSFVFIPLICPQTQNGEDKTFKKWKQALFFLFKKIKNIDFDIALLGCGSYGLPLQGFIKDLGKTSIYVGGALSPLFGVYGERWKSCDFINKNWKRPDKQLVPACAKEIEEGCYW